jgi:hypothetical protein
MRHGIQAIPAAVSGSEFGSDPRWQLVERILQTSPFQKSSHLPALLSYLTEHTIHGQPEALTERRIGIAVFGKAADYSPAEDSAVRVHVRQLRLRLHEYYACEGRGESLVVDIPKGSYALEFHSGMAPPRLMPEAVPAAPPPASPKTRRIEWRDAVALLAVIAALTCGIGWYSAASIPGNAGVPWPLNAVIGPQGETKVVVSDGNSMLRLLGDKELTLEDYLEPGYFDSMIPGHMDKNVSRLVGYVSDSELTSFADVVAASTVVRLAGLHVGHISICSARDLNRRDLEAGNYIFLGGPTSNPWVSLFTDKLNFEVVEESPGGRMYFRNKKPQSGEQAIYEGLDHTGSAGEDYATMSLLPSDSGQGNILILQGLRQEGTEALGVLLADTTARDALKRVLNQQKVSAHTPWFEALIRARAVAGAPVSINVVATRIIHP